MDMHNRHPNAICIICGKGFYKRPSDSKNCECCSAPCKEQNFYNKGQFRLIPYCKEKGITVEDFISKIERMHNSEMKSIKTIAEELGIVRISLMRICKKYKIKTRTVSEDNYRRYSLMTKEQLQGQTIKAHEKIRELFKNEKWKEQQIGKVMSAQNHKPSKPENIFYDKITEMGYIPERQYKNDLAGFALDFAFPDIKLAIEIDGEYWHNLEKVKNKDKRREYFLKIKKGWEVVHIPALAFTKSPEHYLWEVVQIIETLRIAA